MGTKQISAPVEGLIFDNNESVNAVANNNSTVTNPQSVFAVTKGNIGTATPATGEQIAQELAAPELHAIVNDLR